MEPIDVTSQILNGIEMINQQQVKPCLEIVDRAVQFLIDSKASPRIVIKIARNLGDTLHSQPIIKYYRKLHPNAGIVLLCEQRFHGVHEYNKDINGLFLLPNNLETHTRLALWDPIKNNKNIDIAIIPAINPFQAVHPENKWKQPHPNIVEQFIINAGISDYAAARSPIEVIVDDNDRKWADDFAKRHNLGEKALGFEYLSYSIPLAWSKAQYEQFVRIHQVKGWQCVAFAGANEPLIAGAIDARGATWRQTVALMSKLKYFVGCASGNTMLALSSRPQPKLIELNIPEDTVAANTGYILPGNTAINVVRPTPPQIAAMIV